MARRLLNIGAPSTVTHDSAVGNYILSWDDLSGIAIPSEYLLASNTVGGFLRHLLLEYNPEETRIPGSTSTFTSRASFQTSDTSIGSDTGPDMRSSWEIRAPAAFTIIVDGSRYDVLGPNAGSVPSSGEDSTEPYAWYFNTPSLQAVTRAVQEANTATRAAIQLELNDELGAGVVVFDTAGSGTWTVPEGVTSVQVELVGAGGGGGRVSGSSPTSGQSSSFGSLSAAPGKGGGFGLNRIGYGGVATSPRGVSGGRGRSGVDDMGFGGSSGAFRILPSFNSFYGNGGYGARHATGRNGGSGGGGGAYELYDLTVIPVRLSIIG